MAFGPDDYETDPYESHQGVYYDDGDYDLADETGDSRDGPPKHSGTGIVSFILGIGSVLLIVAFVSVAAIMVASNPALRSGETDPAGLHGEAVAGVMLVGSCFIGAAGLALLGLVLAVVSFFQRRRKRLFTVLGTIINGLVCLGLTGLVLYGLLTAA